MILPIKTLLISSLILVMMVCHISCIERKIDIPRLIDLEIQCQRAWLANDNSAADSISKLLTQEAIRANNLSFEAKGYYYQSKYLPHLSREEKRRRMESLNKAMSISKMLDDDSTLCKVYNQKGVWEMKENSAPYTAQYYFNKAIEKAHRINSKYFELISEVNLSDTYRILDDTLGYSHDRRIFELASKNKNSQLLFSAAFHCALNELENAKDTAELQPYADAMRKCDDFPGVIEMVYARYFLNRGELEAAKKYISLADDGNYLDFMIMHAEILTKLNLTAKSDSILARAFDEGGSEIPILTQKIFLLKSLNAHQAGDESAAFEYLTAYDSVRNELVGRSNLDLSNRHRVEYDVLKKEHEIDRQRQHMITLHVIIISIVSLFIIIVASGIFYIKRRNLLYRKTVKQNMESIEREKILSRQMSNLEKELNKRKDMTETSVNTTVSTKYVSEEKADVIFERITTLMDKEELWKDTSLTREVLADKVGCNRTYLSDVIKRKTGLNYSQYINTCRIREAVRRLSDPADSIPLKQLSQELGFITINTFYTSFKQTTGMSPANYRKTAQKINQDNK